MAANAPKKLTVIIALVLAIIALVFVFVPAIAPCFAICGAGIAFWSLFAGFALLLAGCFVKGL